MSLKAKIEAVLFLTSKPVKAQAMARIVNADVQSVRQALLELVHEYEERKGGLEIADDDGYSFQVRDQYASLMDEFLPVEMSHALIRTLSAIAIKQPIAQSEIIRVRGAGAYDHIRELVAKDLVSKKEEQGERSPMLTTTKKFQEYFKLSKEGKDLRNYLKRQVKKADAAAVASAGQLTIPSVGGGNEADDQLNHGIYLETADYVEPSAAESVPFTGDGDSFTPDAQSVTSVEPQVEAAAISEAQGAIPVIELAAEPVPQPAVAEESKTIAVPEPVFEQEAPPALPVEDPAATLSKLAEVAGEAREPMLPETTGKSSVQAHSVKKKEPKIASNSQARSKNKKSADNLLDLLQKQKLLERDLKRGLLDDLIEDGNLVLPLQQHQADPTELSD